MVLQFILFLLISIGGGALGGWMWPKLSKPPRVYLSMPITIGAVLCILLGLYGLQFNSAMLAQIVINTPTQVRIQGEHVQIQGTVSPADSQVYVLVHPKNTDQWWVQPSPIISRDSTLSGTATWIATIDLGNGSEGKNEKFDVMALASTNSQIGDILSGWYLMDGDRIKNIPLISRSNVIVLIRE